LTRFLKPLSNQALFQSKWSLKTGFTKPWLNAFFNWSKINAAGLILPQKY